MPRRVPARAAIGRSYFVYRAYLFTPHGRLTYVGRTGVTVERRAQQHIKEALKGSPYPFHVALRMTQPLTWHWEVLWRGASLHWCMLEETRCIRLERATPGVVLLNATDGGYEEKRRWRTSKRR